MPTIIEVTLVSDAFEIITRVILTSFFWIAGIFGLLKFNVMVATIRQNGFSSPKYIVAAMIVSELAGSVLLITDAFQLGWLGAGWLGVFTFLSIPLGHQFWRFQPPKRMEEMQIALEHFALIGGLMAAAALTAR
ncbi:DoxX family membrane protein [Pararhizobium sp. PWRC1-1]|uniref:DoxX family membrane protein n=1 Tax=Pararhizobium sp. PWRC1-1 TaxID=2804566 RepID=UPI003CFB5120